MQGVDVRTLDGAGLVELRVEHLRPHHLDTTGTERAAGQFGEPAAETLFADRADVPDSGALRVIVQSEDVPNELWMLGPYPVLPCTLSPLELATRRTARCPRITVIDRRTDP